MDDAFRYPTCFRAFCDYGHTMGQANLCQPARIRGFADSCNNILGFERLQRETLSNSD